jgi:hypothetical protein
MAALEAEAVVAERVETVAFLPTQAMRTAMGDKEARAAQAVMEVKEARAVMAAISSSPPRRSRPALYIRSQPVVPGG